MPKSQRSIHRAGLRLVFFNYMASGQWRMVRDKVKADAGDRCQDCGEQIGEKGLAHHLDYRYWGTGGTMEAEHCVWLCNLCHVLRHKQQPGHPHYVDVPFWARADVPEGWEPIPLYTPLRPRSKMGMVFGDYIASERWKSLRGEVNRAAANKCKDCGKQVAQGGVAHHTDYRNWGKGGPTEARDCVWLCKRCHGLRHNRSEGHRHFVEVPFYAKRGVDDGVSFQDEKEMEEAMRLTWDDSFDDVDN